MATSKGNIITHGLSGKVGDILVFSQRGGKTIVSKAPKEHESTDKQKTINRKFQEAVLYAKGAISDPVTKAAYQAEAEEGQSAYNVAVADFFNAPDIDYIDLTSYTGKTGDKITARVTDDFKVTGVTVIIANNDGSLVEQGEAVAAANKIDWVYTTTKANSSLAGDKITIRATDQPGNITEQQQTL